MDQVKLRKIAQMMERSMERSTDPTERARLANERMGGSTR